MAAAVGYALVGNGQCTDTSGVVPNYAWQNQAFPAASLEADCAALCNSLDGCIAFHLIQSVNCCGVYSPNFGPGTGANGWPGYSEYSYSSPANEVSGSNNEGTYVCFKLTTVGTPFTHLGSGFCTGSGSREPMCAPMTQFYLSGTFALESLQQRCRERTGCRAVSYFPLPNSHYTTNDGYLHFDTVAHLEASNPSNVDCTKTPSDASVHTCDCAGGTMNDEVWQESSGSIDSADGHSGWECYQLYELLPGALSPSSLDTFLIFEPSHNFYQRWYHDIIPASQRTF